MAENRFVLTLDEISDKDISHVGGKAAKLGEMVKKGFQIPTAFVLTTAAYSRTLRSSSLESEMIEALSTIDYDNPDTIKAA